MFPKRFHPADSSRGERHRFARSRILARLRPGLRPGRRDSFLPLMPVREPGGPSCLRQSKVCLFACSFVSRFCCEILHVGLLRPSKSARTKSRSRCLEQHWCHEITVLIYNELCITESICAVTGVRFLSGGSMRLKRNLPGKPSGRVQSSRPNPNRRRNYGARRIRKASLEPAAVRDWPPKLTVP